MGTSADRKVTLRVERALAREYSGAVAGLDEVGRGAWAGPVTVGAVVVAASTPPAPLGIADSKALTPAARRALVPSIQNWAAATGVGHASAAEVDAMGLGVALRRASVRALAQCAVAPAVILLDGAHDYLSPVGTPSVLAVTTRIGADRTCASVAAASILAKVARDAIMVRAAHDEPGYGFDKHKGYGTAGHRTALLELGPSLLHRRTWRIPLGPAREPR